MSFQLFAILTLCLSCFFFIKKKTNIFCSSNIIVLTFLLIFVFSPFLVSDNIIIYKNNLLLVIFIAFIVLLVSLSIRSVAKETWYKVNIDTLIPTSKLLRIVVLVLAVRVVYLFLIGSFENLLSINRGIERLDTYYDDNFDLISTFIKYIKLLFLILIPSVHLSRSNKIYVFLGFLLMTIEALAVSQHRTPVITPLLLLFIFIHLYIKKLNIAHFVTIIFLVLIFMSYGAYIRIGDISQADNLTINQRLSHGIRGLNTSNDFGLMHDDYVNGNLEKEYGYQFYLYALTPIPRIFWNNKPNVSFSSRMTENMYGRIGANNWVRTYTVWGEGYSQFGFFGVILYSFLLVFIIKNIIYFISSYSGFEMVIINFLIQLPFYIRADLFAVYARVLDIIVLFVIIYFLFGYKKLHKPKPTIYNHLIK